MPILQPEEYDASYFDGRSQPLQHNAGYDKYERWYRREGENSLGEYYKDAARNYINHLAIANKKVLEIGCAKGFIVEDLREQGVDAYGIDVSAYAIGQASEAVAPYVSVGSIYDLSAYSRNEFDIILTRRLIECLDEVDLPDLITEMSRIGKKQVHIIQEAPNPQYYRTHPIQWWLDNFNWPQGTVIAPLHDEANYLIK